jgi:ABC-type transport system involved in multi-copper enzyme maturation permease subunit
MSGLFLLTLRELTAKKITLGLFLVSTLIWLMLSFALNLDIVDGALAGIRIFGQEATQGQSGNEPASGSLPLLEEVVIGVQQAVAGASYWMGILLALFATAPLISSLLERGRIDLLLSKPVRRITLLGSHMVGVLLVVFILAVYLLGMVWLVISLKSGIWNPRFLTCILMVMIMFTIMYGVNLWIGVWTQSTALSLIITYGLIFCSIVFLFKDQLAPQITLPWRQVFLTLYHILPNFAEVTEPVVQLASGEDVDSWYPLLSSSVFGAVMYALAVVTFNRRDF